jgi:glucose 1-dehydrogenase
MRVFVTDGNTPAGVALSERLTAKGMEICIPEEGESLDSTEGAEKILTRVSKDAPLEGVVFTGDIFIPHTLSEGTEEDFDRVFDSLATRAFFTVKVFGKYLMAQKKGSIVLLSSIHADKPNGVSCAYSIALGAMEMLSREASLELGRHGVRINTVRMGGLTRDRERYGESPLRLYDSFPYTVPRSRALEWKDFAKTAEFLLGADSEGINGTEITADGGLNRGYFQFIPVLRKLKAEKDPLWDQYRKNFGESNI